MHGAKTVSCTVTLKDKTGKILTLNATNQGESLKIFFEHDGRDFANGPGVIGETLERLSVPNWFFYWGQDGVVPELTDPGVFYDPTLTGHVHGGFNFGGSNLLNPPITVGPSALNAQGRIELTLGDLNVTFNAKNGGIDALRATLRHEMRHRELYNEISWVDMLLSRDNDVSLTMQERYNIAKNNGGYKLGTGAEKAFLSGYLRLCLKI